MPQHIRGAVARNPDNYDDPQPETDPLHWLQRQLERKEREMMATPANVVTDDVWEAADYAEELPPEMNVAGGHNHSFAAGISSGSSSSSSTASSSFFGDGHDNLRFRHHTFSDPLCASYFVGDLAYLVKLIIELYDLEEIKPLYHKMNLEWLAQESMLRHRYVGQPPEKKKENLLDDELFKI